MCTDKSLVVVPEKVADMSLDPSGKAPRLLTDRQAWG